MITLLEFNKETQNYTRTHEILSKANGLKMQKEEKHKNKHEFYLIEVF